MPGSVWSHPSIEAGKFMLTLSQSSNAKLTGTLYDLHHFISKSYYLCHPSELGMRRVRNQSIRKRSIFSSMEGY